MKRIYKILIIAGLIIVVIVAIFLGWRKITIKQQPVTIPPEFPEATEDRDGTLEKPSFELVRLSDDKVLVFDFWENTRTNDVYHITFDGEVFNAKQGPDPDVSLQNILALNFTKTSPDGAKVLVAFGDPKKPRWGVFDIIDGVWRPLQLNAEYATWGETGDDIFFISNSNDRTLNSVSLKDLLMGGGSGSIIVRGFNLRDVTFGWLPPGRLIITEKPASFYTSRTWELDLDTLKLSLITAPERGVVSQWLRDTEIVFKFIAPSNFLILDHNLKNTLPVFFTSFPSKCSANSDTVYCFAPKNFPPELPSLALPDDYLKRRFYTTDTLYSIERSSNEISLIFNSGSGSVPTIDAESVKVFNEKIYFINRYDQGLYRITLNPGS